MAVRYFRACVTTIRQGSWYCYCPLTIGPPASVVTTTGLGDMMRS